MRPETAFDVAWAYEFADSNELGEAMMSAGGLSTLVGPGEEPAVRDEIIGAFEHRRSQDGSYRLENESHLLICWA